MSSLTKRSKTWSGDVAPMPPRAAFPGAAPVADGFTLRADHMRVHTDETSQETSWCPIGLRRPMAAHFLGISPSTLDEWVSKGIMPGPKRIGGVVVWDRRKLAIAFGNILDEGEVEGDPAWDNPEA